MSYRCPPEYSSCIWGGELVVLRDGEEVAGTFTHHPPDYTFVPEEPLEVGAVYTVPEFGEVTAIEPAPVDLDIVQVSSGLVAPSERAPAAEVCCSIPYDSCSHYHCWSTEAAERTYFLELYVTKVNAEDEAARMEMRASWTTDAGDGGETPWGTTEIRIPVEEEAGEYCIVPEIRSLISGETRTFPETCFEHGDHQPWGYTELEPPGVETADLALCPVPLEGYEEQWCEETRLLCEEDEFYCDRMAEHCPDVAGSCEVQGVGRMGAGAGNLAIWGILLVAIGYRRRARG